MRTSQAIFGLVGICPRPDPNCHMLPESVVWGEPASASRTLPVKYKLVALTMRPAVAYPIFDSRVSCGQGKTAASRARRLSDFAQGR
eukprot:s1599_g7.t1